jgi:hypothetical protein
LKNLTIENKGLFDTKNQKFGVFLQPQCSASAAAVQLHPFAFPQNRKQAAVGLHAVC